ncbi:MAG: flavin reductase family protein [Burkholderiaceae bacterium]
MSSTSAAVAARLSPTSFRAALGMFATGVTVITARASNGQLVGLTANSFNSVSLDPPLVLWSLNGRSASLAVFRAGTHYAINVLAADQLELAQRFAAPMRDRWAGVAWQPGQSGAPLIDGAAAHFECCNRSRYAEGDHVIFVGQVERCEHRAGAAPLLFHGGRYYTEHPVRRRPGEA